MDEGSQALRAYLNSAIVAHEIQPTTGLDDVMDKKRMSKIRGAALKLKGSKLYQRVHHPGSTTLYTAEGGGFNLEPLGDQTLQPATGFQLPPAEVLAAAFDFPAGHYVLPEGLKGTPVKRP